MWLLRDYGFCIYVYPMSKFIMTRLSSVGSGRVIPDLIEYALGIIVDCLFAYIFSFAYLQTVLGIKGS